MLLHALNAEVAPDNVVSLTLCVFKAVYDYINIHCINRSFYMNYNE